MFAAQRAGGLPNTDNHHHGAIMSEQIVVYWNGFEKNPPLIQDLPAGINVINLFLVGFTASENGTTLKHEYITTGGYSWDQILDQARQARQQHPGLKVCVTIIPPKDGLLWNDIPDPEQFASNVHALIDQWGLDGIDLDTEQGNGVAPDSGFINVVNALGAYFGPRATTGLRMSVVTYRLDLDADLLKSTADAFDAVLLMGYFWSFDQMVTQFQDYAAIVGDSRLYFGVSPTKTQIDVGQLTQWEPDGGQKGGMMEFDINVDAQNDYAMLDTLIRNLP
jgi:hypothetical protein